MDFFPLTETTLNIAPGTDSTVQYLITNQSKKTHTLTLSPRKGITQITGEGNCAASFVLNYQQSCRLTLQINGNELLEDIIGGPVVCQQNNPLQCYQPSENHILRIKRSSQPPIQQYTITPLAGSNGSISPSTVTSVSLGSNLTLMATPASGFLVNQWLLDGNVVQNGGTLYALNNITANHTVSVTFGQVILSASQSSLALMANGNDRTITITITITNTGSIVAENIQVQAEGLPSQTMVLNTSTCMGNLDIGQSCSIIVHPGSTVSSDSSSEFCTSGKQPQPGKIIVSASNATSREVDLLVLNYGCIYQGGYIYAIDDSTSTNRSMGGKVVALEDSDPSFWSEANVAIYGINIDSMPDSPMPAEGYIDGQFNCNGKNDGACNTHNIEIYATQNPRIYAASQCINYTGSGYEDWVLPAFCEMYRDTTRGCDSAEQNILTNIPGLISDGGFPSPTTACAFGENCLFNDYWSSTQDANPSTNQAINIYYAINSGAFPNPQSESKKIRCTRILLTNLTE